MPTLRLKLPDQGEIVHEVTGDRVTIGRRPDNTIQIIDRSVSAHHAELIAEDGHYRLHDLGSTNLSFVNGEAITDYHLHQPCKVTFGTIVCEFDPHDGVSETRLKATQMEKDLNFMKSENLDLRDKILAMQRQVDILSSARLVTKKADMTPSAAHSDTLKTITAERDDLRHQTSALKLELENLRNQLEASILERDAARKTCEQLQTEKVTHWRELQRLRLIAAESGELPPEPSESAGLTVIEETLPPIRPVPARAREGTPLRHTGSEAECADTQRITLPSQSEADSASETAPAEVQNTATAVLEQKPAVKKLEKPKVALARQAPALKASSSPSLESVEAIAKLVTPMQKALQYLISGPDDRMALTELSTYAGNLVNAATQLGDHPVCRIGHAVESFIHDLASRPEEPTSAHFRTISQATDLALQLLEPGQLESLQAVAHPKVLAVDDDVDLLHTLAASLELAHLPTTMCENSQVAHELVAQNDFDLLLLDVNLPGVDGATLCGQIRENERYRKTPVIFLTATNTLDKRAQASLSGGNDFLPKPFNSAELMVKAETLIWKNRLGLL